MRKRCLFLIFTIPLISLNCFAKQTQIQSNSIVAKVNNKIITNLELTNRYKFIVRLSKITISSKQDEDLLLRHILDKMIDEELIRQEAKNLKIEISDNELRDVFELKALKQKKNAAQFKLFFIKNGLSFSSYLSEIEAELMWSKIVSQSLRSKIRISETEVREFFEQQKFDVEVKKFLIAEIVIFQSETALQLAKKLSQELKDGADFKNLAQQFSEGVTAENGGEIGWVIGSDIDKKIYSAISHLKKNDYSDPVLLFDGYHIFKLLDVKSENKIAEHDIKAAENAIFSREIQILAKGHLMELRKKAFVEKNLPN